jgi:hypothetical protein
MRRAGGHGQRPPPPINMQRAETLRLRPLLSENLSDVQELTENLYENLQHTTTAWHGR